MNHNLISPSERARRQKKNVIYIKCWETLAFKVMHLCCHSNK